MGGGDGGSHESEPLIAPLKENDSTCDDTNEELLYAIDSFAAVLKPVSISMVLASIVVNAFKNDTSSSSGGLSAYVQLILFYCLACLLTRLSNYHCTGTQYTPQPTPM